MTLSSPQADYDAMRCVSAESPCPYLPGLRWRSEAYRVESLDGQLHERLLDQGFRRSGRVVYRPRCRSCRACQPFRVSVASFEPSRSMRRVLRRNADVRVEIGRPMPMPVKFDLYQRYLAKQHDDTMGRTYDTFLSFLYNSPTQTCEFCYILGERLVGVSIADRVPEGLSSVYMYFDPDFQARSLGTFSILWEIDFCRRQGLPYYYLGYYVAGSHTMSYKSRFQPGEIIDGDGRWMPLGE